MDIIKTAKVTDHQGKVYNTIEEMCSNYGITSSCYKYRLKNWGDKERALTEPVKRKIHIPTSSDELKTKSEILKELGVSRVNYNELRKLGYTHEEAIKGKRGIIKDHNGVVYKTEKDMCKAWKVNYRTYLRRKYSGRDLEECLMIERVKKNIRKSERYTA